MDTLFDKVPIEGQPLPTGFAKWCRKIDRAICRMQIDGGYVTWGLGVPTIVPATSIFPSFYSGRAGFPWGDNYTFGITNSSSGGVNKIKVWKGKLRRWGDQTYTAADTEVTFSGDGDGYIVWKWSGSGGLEIEDTAQTNYPAESDSTYIYGAVHKLNLSGSTFTLLESIQTGIINAPQFTEPGT